MLGMKKLPIAKRAQILNLLCGGSSMRSVSRLTDRLWTLNEIVALMDADQPWQKRGPYKKQEYST